MLRDEWFRQIVVWKRGVLVACATLSALLLGCGRAAQPVELLNRDANRQYAAAEYAAALEKYRQAEVLRPDLPGLNYNAGLALAKESDFQHSIDEEQKAAVSTDPDTQSRAFYTIGNDDVRLNQLREALDAYKSALRANPSDMDAKYNLEVIQRRVDQEQARRQEVQQQQSQGQQSQGQSGQRSPGPQSQQGQQAPGQQSQQAQPSQQGQAQAGQPGQGQGQPGQPGQNVPSTQGQPGQGAQAGGTGANASASGYTGTAAGQANALDPDLRRALQQFDQSNSINDALQALDIAAQQEKIRQAARGGGVQPAGRDW